VLDWFVHKAFLGVIAIYVFLNQIIGQSCLRVLVVTPHVQLMQARISHRFTHERKFAFIAFTIITTHRRDTDLVTRVWFQSL
jgi:hypothetical protein